MVFGNDPLRILLPAMLVWRWFLGAGEKGWGEGGVERNCWVSWETVAFLKCTDVALADLLVMLQRPVRGGRREMSIN